METIQIQRDPVTGRFLSAKKQVKTKKLKNPKKSKIKNTPMDNLDKFKRKAILKMAKKILKKRDHLTGFVTTLDIKEKLREKHPNIFWIQSEISLEMDRIYQERLIDRLNYMDNGTFREYHIYQPSKNHFDKSSIHELSLTELSEKLRSTNGEMVSVVFIKKDNTVRTILGTVDKNDYLDTLGYIKFDEFGVGPKRVNPRSLQTIYFKGDLYKIKK